MHYALFYDYVPEMATKRAPFREEHLALVRRLHGEGKLTMAGAWDPLEGALLVFKGEGPQMVEEFVSKDPYMKNKLVIGHRIKAWNVVVGA